MNRPTDSFASPASGAPEMGNPAAPRGFGRRPAMGGSPANRRESTGASPAPAARAMPPAASAASNGPARPSQLEMLPTESFAPAASPAPAREIFDPPPLPPIVPIAAQTTSNGGARKRRMILMLLLTMGLGGLYLMQSARAGAPDCAGADATRLLRETLRERLAKQNPPARAIEFAEMGAMISDDHGADACRAVLVVDGEPAANLVYRLTLKLRLVVYNRYAIELLGETPI